MLVRDVHRMGDPRGSVWRRWDPHIHTPGTVLNNGFSVDDWDEYLRLLESQEPRIVALGVTDYCSIDRYEDVLRYSREGRLPDVGLIFPNVELRLMLATRRMKPLNAHLLVSPEDADHVNQARRFLRELKFDYRGEQYGCDQADLTRLGRKHDPSIVEDGKALAAGTNQFKVTPAGLKQAMTASGWARGNIIIAVAGGSGDGSSGLRDQSASFEATRVEIERMAHVIFTGQADQRSFWLGDGEARLEALEEKWGGRKLCIHGCDAHDLASVGAPAANRFTWIKGDATFDSLRQACIEPRERSLVGDEPPSGPIEYRTIDSVSVTSPSWAVTPRVVLNRGLVAIIGPRGSGKTALADLIAAAADAATPDRTNTQSFLRRADRLLRGATVELNWVDGATTRVAFPQVVPSEHLPRVQYLSQQFVEQLCSSEGIADELLHEMERVVFEAVEPEKRLGASDFQELLGIKAASGRTKREYAREEMSQIGQRLQSERESQDGLRQLEVQKTNLEEALKNDEQLRQQLIASGSGANSQRLDAVNTALARVQSKVDGLEARHRSLLAIAAAAKDLEERTLPAIRARLEEEHSAAALTAEEWGDFDVVFKGSPKATLDKRTAETQDELKGLVGPEIQEPSEAIADRKPFVDYAVADFQGATRDSLRAESSRLSGLLGLDAARTKRLSEVSGKLKLGEAQLVSLVKRIAWAQGAGERRSELEAKRRESYARLFDGVAEEQVELGELYRPLEQRLGQGTVVLKKLSFTVRRVVDVEAWARRGEELLDLRTGGGFRGHGTLLAAARQELQAAWETGSGEVAAAAMAKFRLAHDRHLVEQARVDRANQIEYRRWAAAVGDWLYSTDHITLQYGVQYDGVDVEQLSPGTRGIVVLLLYLSLDVTDDRPLIIDQPEENLDPKSVFDELVDRFRLARTRRQIIIVTHNSNLVVNTDADQVIIASAGGHKRGKLPRITYVTGGLEDAAIRSAVCETLEGGRRAFEERARRLRLSIE